MDSTTFIKTDALAPPHGWFRWAGLFAVTAAIAAVAADITAVALLKSATFLETSVSATAIGKHSWFVDAAIYLTGAAIAVLAFAFHHWNIEHGRYRFGIFCLAALVITIFLLAGWDAYDPLEVPDFGFHMILVYALSALFPLAALTLARALSKVRPFWGYFSITLAVLWLICGPIYAVTPEELEGLFQRIAFVFMLLWVAGIGLMFVSVTAPRAERRVDPSAEGA
ncbi:MAG TPA: DUF998 domain-containing protein [Candidatus Binatia bacterium]|nr:DUF998 domain-containing protein [Candidatus Binatia bacterium]